jgi:DNA-binding winged helix-turn-helix (wHTH) protein
MEVFAAHEAFLFAGFRLDRRAGGLFRADENGALMPVALGSRSLDLLTLLVRRHGELVPRDEIMAVVWPGVIVEDSNLPTQIAALRRVLDRVRPDRSCIQTVAGRGYRFIAPVVRPDLVPEEELRRTILIFKSQNCRSPISLPSPFFHSGT